MKLVTAAAIALLLQSAIAHANEISLTNVYEAFGKERKGLQMDSGFSTLVRYKGKTILFDAGANADIFAKNLKALKIDPKSIDIVVGSHSHHDHIAGIDYVLKENPRVKLYLPKDFFGLGGPIKFPFKSPDPAAKKRLPKEQQYYGGQYGFGGKDSLVSSSRFWNANIEWVTEPKEVLPGVTIVPTTSKLMGTFIAYPPNDKKPKLIGMPELSVSFETSKGDVLLVGCSHSSVEAIVVEALKVTKRKLQMVAGGFHLIPYDRSYLTDLAKRLKTKHGVTLVAPAHCTGLLAFDVFRTVYAADYRFFGLGEQIVL